MSPVKSVCHTCGGRGKEGGCPKCGLTTRAFTEMRTMSLDIPADVIPAAYQGKLWTKPPIVVGTPHRILDYDNKLEQIHKMFLSGNIPKFSVFMSAPPKSDKHLFAYSCLQTALVQSYTIAPLFTTADWRRLYKVSQMNPFYKLYDLYKWDDLVSRDIVFLSVDHSDDRFDSLSLIKDILDTRAGFGKPTFIISDYSLQELAPRWNTEEYTKIYNADPERDYNRYPVILHREE